MRFRFVAAAFALFAPVCYAGATNAVVFLHAVPTLDDVGLVAVTLVVAVAGALAARRRRK